MEFRKQSLPVGSGVVEDGCKSLVRTRLKRADMYWTNDWANAIIALRSYILSGRYEDSWSSEPLRNREISQS